MDPGDPVDRRRLVGWPAALGGAHPTPFQRWLEPVLLPIGGHAFHFHEASHALEWTLMAISVGIALFGMFLAYRLYVTRARRCPTSSSSASVRASLLENKYWVDELYNATVIARHARVQPSAVVVRHAGSSTASSTASAT